MKRFTGVREVAEGFNNPIVTIGNFDGVHKGHQEILRRAQEERDALGGGDLIVFTFQPHPHVVLRPEARVELLTHYSERADRLGESQVTALVEEPFSRNLSTRSPEQFFNEFLVRGLGAKVIVVGYDFAFGKEREGSLDRLKALCEQAGVKLVIVPPFEVNGEVVSSTRIREYLKQGRVRDAERLLGYAFFYKGVVQKGDGRGHQLGFPTANLKLETKLTLPYGVYATRALVKGRVFDSITNVGVRPTFHTEEEAPVLIETHLFDVDLDLYGEALQVEFVDRVREERKFPSLEALKAQIIDDITTARQQLKKVVS